MSDYNNEIADHVIRTIITKPEPPCPKCGARMVLRRPREDQVWKPFWGCNRFPDCKGTRSINFTIGKPFDDIDIGDDSGYWL